MAYVSKVEGSYGAAASVDHFDSAQLDSALHGASQHSTSLQFNAPPHSVIVPDADLLFNGTYHRAGPDLVITGHDGQHFLVPGYFSSEHPPALMAPNGASLTGDVVNLMAGSPTPEHYAQTQPTTPPDAIGKVEKVVGDVTAVRNGVAVTLHVGDAVFKSDVVQTGAGSSVGISFPDGSAFNLVANTRMALTEYSYDPNSHSNEALMTLVQGTFAFVAGKVAHSGDMKIETPVATMGIRGTTGVVEQQPPGTVSANLGQVSYSFAVVKDFGTDINGAYTLCYLDPSTGACNVFTTIGQIDYITTVTPLGVGLAPDVRVEPISNAQFAFEQEILQQLFQTLNPTNQQNNGSNGSSTFPGYTPPNNNPQLFEPPPTFVFPTNFNPGGPGGPGSPTITALVLPPPPVVSSTVVIWIGPSGNWVTPSDWNPGQVPGSGNPTVEILAPVTVTIDNAESVNNLVLGPGAILDIIPGGSLTVFGSITGGGMVELNAGGGDPTFWVNGTVTLSGGGTIELTGSPSGDNNILGVASTNAKLVNIDYTIEGAGNIGAGDGHLTFINCGTVNANVAGQTLDIHTGNTVENGDTTVAPGASPVMEATNGGTLRIEDNVSNLGLITALTGGILQFEDITVTNAATGAVQVGAKSTLDLDNSSALGGSFDNKGNVFVTGTSVLHGDIVTNEGNIFVGAHAALTLEGDTDLFNAEGALIQASGTGAKITVEIDADQNVNSGTMLAVNGGEIDFEININGGSNQGLIEAGAGGTVNFFNNHSGGSATGPDGGGSGTGGNYGTMEADHGGHLTFNGGLDNYNLVEAVDGGIVNLTDGMKNHAGTVHSTGDGSQITLSNGDVVNDATFTADEGGTITFDATLTGLENDGVIQALADGTIVIDGFAGDGFVENDGGRIQANGEDARVELAGATIVDGTVASSDGGVIETISGTSIFQDVTLDDHTVVKTDAGTFLDLEGTTTLGDPVTFEGKGTFVLTGDGAEIVGSGEGAGLDNKGTITGAGAIGNGEEGTLNLRNEGTINANVADGAVTIDTGSTDCNAGTMKATNGGTLIIDDDVDNRGGSIGAFGTGSVACNWRPQIQRRRCNRSAGGGHRGPARRHQRPCRDHRRLCEGRSRCRSRARGRDPQRWHD
jgi:FecR protein